MPEGALHGPSALTCAILAYRFLFRKFVPLVRALLLTTSVISADYLLSLFVLPLITASRSLIMVISIAVALGGIALLWACVGFLIAPVVARSTGSVLRKALHSGLPDIQRNFVLTA